jgi:hypothetical protein
LGKLSVMVHVLHRSRSEATYSSPESRSESASTAAMSFCRILRMAEGDSLALRTRGHRSYAAARRASGKSVLSYKRRISLLLNRSSSTSR